MTLTDEQRNELNRRGFLTLQAATPPAQVERALRQIHHWVGTAVWPGLAADDRQLLQDTAGHGRAGSLLAHEAVTSLVTDGVWSVVEALVGPLPRPSAATQIVLRPPELPPFAEAMVPHVDYARRVFDAGLLTEDGIRNRGAYMERLGTDVPMPDYTANVLVALTSVDQDDGGNLGVFPGSHLRLADHFASTATSFGNYDYLVPPRFDPGPLLQTRQQPGDVVILNSQLVHCVRPNRTTRFRTAVYFRIESTTQKSVLAPHLDPWAAWPGIR